MNSILNQKLQNSFAYFVKLMNNENIDEKFKDPIILKEFDFHIAPCECINCFSKIKQEQHKKLYSNYRTFFNLIICENSTLNDVEIAKLIFYKQL